MNKLPDRYYPDAMRMRQKLLDRLIASKSKGLKKAKYAALYGASWPKICLNSIPTLLRSL